MSVYRPKGSPFYHFDFRWRCRRFHGSTGETSRREAQAVERAARDQAKEVLRSAAKSKSASGLTIDLAAGRYWREVGMHHSGASNTWRDLARLVTYFGKDRLLDDIDDSDVAAMVARRRDEGMRRRRGKKTVIKPLSNATVNRSTTEVLRKLFTRAKHGWRIEFRQEPRWREHMLSEPQEHVRELHQDEAMRLQEQMTDSYGPFFAFARATGFRLNECILRWSEVNWATGQIAKSGKGGRRVTTPITPAVRAILWPLREHHPEFVFTYAAQATRGEHHIRHKRYPITYQGAKTRWRRMRSEARVESFRFHDFRHDLATKLLRQTGNLKLVQRALNHADLKTTARYAHVLDEDLVEALSTLQSVPLTEVAKNAKQRR